MNERIKELAVQAGAGEWGDSVIAATMDIEKFAELIVRECCNIVSDEVECVYHFDNQHPVVARLKEHFGVE